MLSVFLKFERFILFYNFFVNFLKGGDRPVMASRESTKLKEPEIGSNPAFSRGKNVS